MENLNLEKAAAARDVAEEEFKRATENLKAFPVPTEEQLRAIIEGDNEIDDELAYFTEDIQRIFKAVLKGDSK